MIFNDIIVMHVMFGHTLISTKNVALSMVISFIGVCILYVKIK